MAPGMVVGKILLISLASLMLCSCSGKHGNEKGDPAKIKVTSITSDSTYLFDGKTLNGWEITNFGPQGSVYVSGGDIILGMGDGCTGITWKGKFPEMNYKVNLEAKRIEGNDFFCGMTFPVHKDLCTLIVGGWGGTVVGLSSINKMDASENETTTIMKFEKDRWYNICLIVKEDAIRALIDDSVIIDFERRDKILSIRPEVELSKPFGIASWMTTAGLRNIRVEKIGK